jgi:Family of unknown function (DUF5681)
MTDPPHDSVPTFQPKRPTEQREFGYGKPPKHSQFAKGRSGNPGGRPKAQVGISIKEILDGDQRGKNGEVISRREAYVIALVNGALGGNQKAFSKFMNLMNRSGLMRRETVNRPSVVNVPVRTMTKEEYDKHIRSMSAPPKRA